MGFELDAKDWILKLRFLKARIQEYLFSVFAQTLPLSKKTLAWVTRGRCEDCLPRENQAMLIHND